jgi:hypothetical protein
LLLDPIASAAFEFTLQVERLYTALVQSANSPAAAEPRVGGRLLYAGELNADGRALLVAGNIAGAASLAATADPAARKQALRDGVADFLVTSLDEALRILKNEIRKRETVSVCIACAPQDVEREMRERGVLPDLLGPLSSSASPSSVLFARGVPRIQMSPALAGQVLVTWSVATAPAQWLPKLDAIAIACVCSNAGHESLAARRWLRLAPRYLGRLARGLRMFHCELVVAKEFVARVQGAVEGGEIGEEVQISLTTDEETFLFRPSPKPNC